jgi:hypothetical protein
MAKVWEVQGSQQKSDPMAERPWPELVTLLELDQDSLSEDKPILSAETSIFTTHVVVELDAVEADSLGIGAGYSVSPLQPEVARDRLRQG